MRCDCTQGPELRQTGRSDPDADLICPSCSLHWWSCQGAATKERPATWPSKKDDSIHTWEIKRGGWVTA